VGTQTVIDDNPKLDVRDWTGGKQSCPNRFDQKSRIQKKEKYLTIKQNNCFSQKQLYPTKHL
jgi:riboflavin biosynthesis pyrimidine reductase